MGAVLARNRGIGPSFDHLRLILALAVLLGHAHWTAAAPSLDLMFTHHSVLNVSRSAELDGAQFVGFVKAIDRALLPAFFALSGFLVLGSALRVRATSTFLAHRALRIVPALLVEVTLSALILGPLLTTLPLRDYFSDPQFTRYFGNILGWVTFSLPGMFQDNPVPELVNVNLWTLPSEFRCYFITAVLLLTGVIYNKTPFMIVFVLVTVSLAVAHFFHAVPAASPAVLPPHVLVYCFFTGALCFHYKEKIPANAGLFAVAAPLAYAGLIYDPLTYLAPVPLTYCTVVFGLVRLPKIGLVTSGDYSYGVYLYGFPIVQTYMHLFPGLKGHFVPLAALAGSTTLVFAAFSWHVIEKRALTLKARLPQHWFPAAHSLATRISPLSTPEEPVS